MSDPGGDISVHRPPATRFVIPPGREASAPPEVRGRARDAVRLLVARPQAIEHRSYRGLPDLLDPGDVVVVNTSATLPAAFDARSADGAVVPVHYSTQLDDGSWVVELRRRDRRGPDLTRRRGEQLQLPGGIVLRLTHPYPVAAAATTRLWQGRVRPHVDVTDYLLRYGHPISYEYVPLAYPLDAYQTVYAGQHGSAEMASAGRPITAHLLARLLARGVIVVPIVLHAGVSSPELHEPPLPERFDVPDATAHIVNSARSTKRRVVAVGTTVVRALESAVVASGRVSAVSGWTSLVLGPDRPARAVTGLLTGLHAPEASHLLLLEAVAGERLVGRAYAAAVEAGYLWHEFGDSTLFLP